MAQTTRDASFGLVLVVSIVPVAYFEDITYIYNKKSS